MLPGSLPSAAAQELSLHLIITSHNTLQVFLFALLGMEPPVCADMLNGDTGNLVIHPKAEGAVCC